MSKGEPLEAKIEAQLREWAAELESLKAKADKAVAEARRGYYEHIDELREEIEAKLKAWSKTLESFEGQGRERRGDREDPCRETSRRDPDSASRAPTPHWGSARSSGEGREGGQASGEGVAGEAGACPGRARRIEDGRGEGLERAQGRVGQRDRQIPGAFLGESGGPGTSSGAGNGPGRSKASFLPPFPAPPAAQRAHSQSGRTLARGRPARPRPAGARRSPTAVAAALRRLSDRLHRIRDSPAP